MYSSERIRGLLLKKGVVPIRVDMTSASPRTEAAERLLNSLGGNSIPFMSVHPPGAEWLRPWRFRDLVTIGQVAGALESLPDVTVASR